MKQASVMPDLPSNQQLVALPVEVPPLAWWLYGAPVCTPVMTRTWGNGAGVKPGVRPTPGPGRMHAARGSPG